MDKNRLDEIIYALTEKGVNQPCPRCTSRNFSVVGETEITVENSPLPGKGLIGRSLRSFTSNVSLPTIVIACDNCGYITQHAQASLGLTKSPSFSLKELRDQHEQ